MLRREFAFSGVSDNQRCVCGLHSGEVDAARFCTEESVAEWCWRTTGTWLPWVRTHTLATQHLLLLPPPSALCHTEFMGLT